MNRIEEGQLDESYEHATALSNLSRCASHLQKEGEPEIKGILVNTENGFELFATEVHMMEDIGRRGMNPAETMTL